MQNHPKTRLQNLSQTLPSFEDHAKIFQDLHFSRNYSIHLELWVRFAHYISFFGTSIPSFPRVDSNLQQTDQFAGK